MGCLFDETPEGYLSEQDAKRVIAPYSELLNEAWRDGWEDWLSFDAVKRSRLLPRTRACSVNDFAVARARQLFGDRPGVRTCDELGFFKLRIRSPEDELVIVRLKRLGVDHLARNIKTKQQKDYYNHAPVPGIPLGATRLTVGYVLDATQTRVESVVASLQLGLRDLIYSFGLDAEPDIKGLPVPLPPDMPEVRPPVRLKPSKKSQESGKTA
jgi:hypothetical protein